MLIEFSDLREYGVPYCRSHVARLEAAGKFPKRVQIGDCRIGWVEKEVEDWVAVRIAQRDTVKP